MSARLSLSPSSSHRWLTCTASPNFILDNDARLPKESSSYSEEGNKAHNAAAAGLLMGREAMIDVCDGDGEMLEHVSKYVEFVTEKQKSGDELLVESEVPIWFNPGRRGFIDHCVIGPKRMYMTDLKYGEGVPVTARGNTQMAIYGMSLLQSLNAIYDFPPDYLITMVIYQPRCRGNSKKPYSLWSTTVEELVQFVKFIADTAEGIKTRKQYEFVPSEDNCRFCRGVSLCRARAQQLLGDNEDILPAKPDPVQTIYLKDPASLDADTLTFLLKNKSAIESWLEKLKKYAYSAVKGGMPELVGNHWKLVQSKDGNRFYTDQKKAAEFLKQHIPEKDLYTPSSILSPAQAEKKLAAIYGKDIAWELLKEYTSRPAGGEALAPADDTRESITENHLADFEDLTAHDLL